jgi:hypothetical protein
MGGLVAAGVSGFPTLAAATVQTAKLTQAFAYLDSYLSLAPAKRDRFHLVYYAVRDRKFAPDLKATVIGADGKRAPLVLEHDARVVQLPSLALLRSGSLEFDAAPSDKVGLALVLEPMMAPSTHLDARGLAASIAQAAAAVASIAGVLSFAAPKIVAALFPGAPSGEAALDNGHSQPLPIGANRFWGALPYYEPDSMAGARSLTLARAPSRILLSGHPK